MTLLCPNCGACPLPTTVHLSLDQLRRDPEHVVYYSRCPGCRATFARRHQDDQPTAVAESEWSKIGQLLLALPPWIDQTDLAMQFLASWEAVHQFFVELAQGATWLAPMPRLIADLRQRGFERTLRAGQSLNTFIVSRAREHGLRAGQSHLQLMPGQDGSLAVTGIIADQPVRLDMAEAAVTPALLGALQRLVARDVD